MHHREAGCMWRRKTARAAMSRPEASGRGAVAEPGGPGGSRRQGVEHPGPPVPRQPAGAGDDVRPQGRAAAEASPIPVLWSTPSGGCAQRVAPVRAGRASRPAADGELLDLGPDPVVARTARDRDAADPAAGGSSGKTAGRGDVVRRTMAVNLRLLCSPVTRPLYLALWVPNGLVVGCESLFVPYGTGRPAGTARSPAACPRRRPRGDGRGPGHRPLRAARVARPDH